MGGNCHFLLQGIFLSQGSNPGLLHRRQILYHLSQQGREAWSEASLKMQTTTERIHRSAPSTFQRTAPTAYQRRDKRISQTLHHVTGSERPGSRYPPGPPISREAHLPAMFQKEADSQKRPCLLLTPRAGGKHWKPPRFLLALAPSSETPPH